MHKLSASTNTVALLIHGTRLFPWWPRTRWKYFSKQLRRRFPEIKIRYVQWSGGNSFDARSAAAARVIRCVRRHRAAHGNLSNTKFMLFGHSHGGTVLALALLDDETSGSCIAAVTVATPFIRLRLRPLLDRAIYTLLISCALWMAVTVTALTYFYDASQSGVSFREWAEVQSRTGIPQVDNVLHHWRSVGAVLVGCAFVYRLIKSGRERVNTLVKASSLDELYATRPRMLIMRSPGDEATFGIGATQAAAWVIRVVASPLEKLAAMWLEAAPRQQEVTFREAVKIVGIIWGSVAAWMLSSVVFEGSGMVWWTFELPAILVFVGLTLWFASMAVYFLLAAPSFVLTSLLLRLTFGRELLPFALFVEPTVDATPYGEWVVHQHALHHGITVPFLAHGFGFSEQAHVQAALDWLERLPPQDPR
jgi:hypothetical protein